MDKCKKCKSVYYFEEENKNKNYRAQKQNVYRVNNNAGEYNKIKYICKIVYKL